MDQYSKAQELAATPQGLPTAPVGEAAPVSEKERIAALDMMRGVAILGILLVNVASFALPSTSIGSPLHVPEHTWASAMAFNFMFFFAFVKFFPLFSCLFGAGLILQVSRFEAKSVSPFRYLKRLAFLAVVGLLHAAFIWYGDILFFYACCGLLVFVLRPLSEKILGILGLCLILLPPLLFLGLGFVLYQYVDMDEYAKRNPYHEMTVEEALEELSYWEQVGLIAGKDPIELAHGLEQHYYQEGTYSEVFFLRISQYGVYIVCCGLYFGWAILGWMLIGTWFMKSGVFADPEKHRALFKKLALFGFFLGAPLTGVALWTAWQDNIGMQMMSFAFVEWGGLGMTLAYIGTLSLFSFSDSLKRILSPIVNCGRMAFTNYVMQSLIMVVIFYNYGLGLFGRYNFDTLLLFVLGTWIFQIIFSTLWLRFFRFGPLEWIWRSWTYGKVPQLLR